MRKPFVGGGGRPSDGISEGGQVAGENDPVAELDLDAARATLTAHLQALRERRGVITKAPERGTGVSFGKRVGDGTTEAVSRLSGGGGVDTLNATEERSERALAKLDEGSYGVFDRC